LTKTLAFIINQICAAMSSVISSPARTWKSINVNGKPPRKKLRSSLVSRAISPLADHNNISIPLDEPQQITQCYLGRQSKTQKQGNPSVSLTAKPACSPDEEYKVAIDFRTTFTAVAFVLPGFDPENLHDILTIKKFPNDPFPSNEGRQVPTESWYPNRPGRGKKRKQRDISVMPSTEMLDDNTFGANYNDAVCEGYLQGFDIQDQLGQSITDFPTYTRDRRVSRMKLLLDNSPLMEGLRGELKLVLDNLKRDKLIKKDEDVIRDYLAVLMLHTKERLETYHGFNSQSKGMVPFNVSLQGSLLIVLKPQWRLSFAFLSVGPRLQTQPWRIVLEKQCTKQNLVSVTGIQFLGSLWSTKPKLLLPIPLWQTHIL
jgi:hypothetical protein